MPKKSKNNLSFSSAWRYFFYLGGSIWMTFILRIYYMFTDLLTRRYSCVNRFSLYPAGILAVGPMLRRLIGILGTEG
jgi:hypothetical protein